MKHSCDQRYESSWLFPFRPTEWQTIDVQSSLSSVSMENARQNMEQEAPHWDFDRYVAAADADWEKQLGKIEVKGTEVQKEIFYTALYHTMIHLTPCPT